MLQAEAVTAKKHAASTFARPRMRKPRSQVIRRHWEGAEKTVREASEKSSDSKAFWGNRARHHKLGDSDVALREIRAPSWLSPSLAREIANSIILVIYIYVLLQ